VINNNLALKADIRSGGQQGQTFPENDKKPFIRWYKAQKSKLSGYF
jgi:hypothetical protein